MANASEAFLNSFLEQTAEQGELNTEYFICPELEEAPANIVDYQLRSGMSASKDGEEEKPWVMLSFKWDVDDQSAREAVGRDNVHVYGQPIFLSITPDGKLDSVNNQSLGRLLKLFNTDITGMSMKEIFESFKGQRATVKIGHRALTMKDGSPLLDEAGEQRYSAEVVAVGAL